VEHVTARASGHCGVPRLTSTRSALSGKSRRDCENRRTRNRATCGIRYGAGELNNRKGFAEGCGTAYLHGGLDAVPNVGHIACRWLRGCGGIGLEDQVESAGVDVEAILARGVCGRTTQEDVPGF